jgi:transglutaminase-like putative cysteine protease
MHELMTRAAGQVELLDHQIVEWSQVRRTRYWMHQRFQYHYPGRVRELRQRLIVIPPDRYGDQRLRAHTLHVSAPGAAVSAEGDSFGNQVVQVYIPEVDREVSFELRLLVERDLAAAGGPRVGAGEFAAARMPTPLTAADARIADVAHQLAAVRQAPEQLAEAINDWVYGAMRYGAGATSVETTAAEALAIGRGLCQDYAHVMLAICRAAGLPARYISGHMLGEGGSHAWVEVLLASPRGGYRALALDPTNHRRTTPAYITIAVGRDYSDVSPTSGSFIAPYPGQLTASKRAGLTELEYRQE